MTFRLRRWTPVLMVSGGLVVFVSGSWLPGLSGCDGGEVADGNSLVAVRAGPAGADTAAEGSAVVAALPAEVAGLAGRTLVHGALSRRRWRGQTCGQRPGDRAAAAAGLAARIGAPAAPSRGGERLAAGRAGGAGIVTAVVTRRHRWPRRLGWRCAAAAGPGARAGSGAGPAAGAGRRGSWSGRASRGRPGRARPTPG